MSEVSKLCHRSLRSRRGAEGIVKLEGWGIDLDSLEDKDDYLTPRLPLLILEKAESDLYVFMEGSVYAGLGFHDIRLLALDVGNGLSAIHRAGIAHRDIKLQNVLLFPPTQQDGNSSSFRWSAKICDFGHAVDSNEPVSTKLKDGTQAWKPPEYYGADALVDPRACDIFSYGLLVWAMFTRIHDSPLLNIPADELSDAWGQQKPYHDAQQDIYTYLAPKPQRQVYLSTPQLDTSHRWMTELEGNCVLAVLAKALNDDPRDRLTQPPPHFWLNYDRVSISALSKGVAGPRRIGKRPSNFTSTTNVPRRLPSQPAAPSTFWLGSRLPGVPALIFYARTLIPFRRRKMLRQRKYERLHWILSDLFGFDLEDTNLIHDVPHVAPSQCLALSDSRRAELRRFIHSVVHIEMFNVLHRNYFLDTVYSFARARCRFRPCCWQNILAVEPSVHDNDTVFQGVEAGGLEVAERQCCDEVAAWALRRKSALSFHGHFADVYFLFYLMG